MRKANVGNDSNKPESPVVKYLQWANLTKEVKDADGDLMEKVIGGKFVIKTKEEDENGDNIYGKIDVPLPVTFTLLDANWFSFKGYDEPNKIGYWSNEVNNFNDTITVMSKEGVFMKFTMGQYVSKDKSFMEKLNSKNIRNVKSVYAAMKNEDDELEIVNFQLKGTQTYVKADKKAGFDAFINANGKAVLSYDIVVPDAIITQKDKSSNKYAYPVWSLSKKPTDPKLEDELNEMYDTVEEYHKEYVSYTKSFEKEKVEELETVNTDDNDYADEADAPF